MEEKEIFGWFVFNSGQLLIVKDSEGKYHIPYGPEPRRQISYSIRTGTSCKCTCGKYNSYNRRNIRAHGKGIRHILSCSGKRGQRTYDERLESVIRCTSIRRILQSRKSIANPELGQEQPLLPYVRSSHRTGLSYRQALSGMPSGILSAYISGSDSSHKEGRQSSVSSCEKLQRPI